MLIKSEYSIFTRDFGRYKNTIAHSETFLLELDIQSCVSRFTGSCKIVLSISRNYTFNLAFPSICTR